MVLAGIVAGLTVLTGLILVGGVCFYVAKQRIAHFIRAFITPASPDGPSPFALLCQSIASVFGTAISASLKATFMGLESADAKAIKKGEANVVLSRNPMLAALVAGFPNLAKKFLNNPAMASLADLAIRKMTAAPKPGQENIGDNHQATNKPVQFKF